MTTLNELHGEASTKPTGPTNSIEPTVSTPTTDTDNDSETVSEVFAPSSNVLPAGPANTNNPPTANDLPTGSENALLLSPANTQESGSEKNLNLVAASTLPASLLKTLNMRTNILSDALIESGLIFHLKADALPVLADGANLADIVEISENENTIVGTAAYLAPDESGKAAIKFRRFLNPDYYVTDLSVGPQATIFMVFRQAENNQLARAFSQALLDQALLTTDEISENRLELKIRGPSIRKKYLFGGDPATPPDEGDGWSEDFQNLFSAWNATPLAGYTGGTIRLDADKLSIILSDFTTGKTDPHLNNAFLTGALGLTSGPSGNGTLDAANGDSLTFQWTRPVEVQHVVFGGVASGEAVTIELLDAEGAVKDTIIADWNFVSVYQGSGGFNTRIAKLSTVDRPFVVRERESMRIRITSGTVTLLQIGVHEASGASVVGTVPQAYIASEDFLNGRPVSVGGAYIKEGFNVLCASVSEMPIGNLLSIGANGNQEHPFVEIREVLIFNRVLLSAERTQVTRSLTRDHGIDAIEVDVADPVDRVNCILGAAQIGNFDGIDDLDFGFGEDRQLTLDCAKLAYQRGASVFKFGLGPTDYGTTDATLQTTVDPAINSLTELARDNPVAKAILDIPFPDMVLWAYTLGVGDWRFNLPTTQGYQDTVRDEWYAFTVYLRNTYKGTGRRFFLGDWEGDWQLAGLGSIDPDVNITDQDIAGYAAWTKARQDGIDQGKAATPDSDVHVWNYCETNKLSWGVDGNRGVINSILPALTKVDYVSISANEFRTMTESEIHQALSLVESKLPEQGGPQSGPRMFISEYNINRDTLSDADHAQLYKDLWSKLFEWDGSGLEFILHWKYAWQSVDGTGDREDSSQVDGSGALTHIGKLHCDFQEKMRIWQRTFYRGTGRSPTWQEIRLKAEELVPTLSHN